MSMETANAAAEGKESQIELLWPTKERGWIQLGTRQYQVARIFDFNSAYITQIPSSNWYEDGYITPWKPSPLGACFLEMHGLYGFWIYSNSGEKKQHVSCLAAKKIRPTEVFWCNNGCIGFLGSHGDVIITTMSGEKIKRIKSPDHQRVVCHRAFPGGIAFVTEAHTLYVFEAETGSDNQMTYSFTEYAPGQIPDALSAVGFCDGKAFIACLQDLYAVEVDRIVQIDTLQFVPTHIFVAPRGNLVAACYERSMHVMSPTSQIKFPEIVSKDRNITSVAFVDDATVAFVSGNKLQTITAGSIPRAHNGDFLMVAQDSDSVRILKRDEACILSPVHESVLRLFQKPTLDRLNTLIEAKTKFEEGDIDSRKLLEGVKLFLESLVLSILEAVQNIYQLPACQKLLELAAFAKYQLPTFKHNTYANCVRDLQVLHNLRSDQYGWLITGNAFQEILSRDKKSFISMVSQLGDFPLAFALCQKYDENPSMVAENWAISMFRRYQKDALGIVLEKLAPYDQIDYVKLASVAKRNTIEDKDRMEIIKRERDPKVRMLYILRKFQVANDAALREVIESLDGNAIVTYMYIQKMKRGDAFGDLLAQNPVLAEHYTAYKKYETRNGWKKVMSIPKLAQNKKAALELLYGWQDEERRRNTGFGQCPDLCGEMKTKYFSEKNSPYAPLLQNQATLIDESKKYYPSQSRELEAYITSPCKSPRDLMKYALVQNDERMFTKISKMYKISDRTKAWIRIQTYLEKGMDAKIMEMAKGSQTLPWETLADECFRCGKRKETVAFASRISNSEKRIKLLLGYKYYEEASDMAAREGDMEQANEIRRRAFANE